MRIAIATVAACVLVLGGYLALGGGSYEPTPVTDPCEARSIGDPDGIDEVVQQVALSALDGAACELRVTREDLLAALADPERRARFLDERQISDATLEATVGAGLDRAYADAIAAGQIDGIEELLLGEAIERAPLDVIVDIAQSETAQGAAGLLGDVAD